MSDPYKILGVSPAATDEQIKAAYRELAKKYHPDNYAGSPIADLAGEKMKEINEAYDEVMNQRRNNKSSGGAQYSGGYGGAAGSGGYQNSYGSAANSSFRDVRNLIMAGRVADAEQILNGVPLGSRNAEWYFLKGSILYQRGWLEEAHNHFTRACQMDPNNLEYRAALNQSMNQRGGVYGGYNTSYVAGGCNSCDTCMGLLCADSCCECMGGDLVPCC